jgi:hypothetical protein
MSLPLFVPALHRIKLLLLVGIEKRPDLVV